MHPIFFQCVWFVEHEHPMADSCLVFSSRVTLDLTYCVVIFPLRDEICGSTPGSLVVQDPAYGKSVGVGMYGRAAPTGGRILFGNDALWR